MKSSTFEELDLPPELVEALAGEGAEIPTAFQREAIPLLRKGNPLLAGAGPGSGTLIAYGIPLLERMDPTGGELAALVMAPTPEAAHGLALSLGRLALTTGHRVAALGEAWALPEQAQILLGSPRQILGAVQASRIKLDTVAAVVVDGAGEMEALGEWEAVTTLMELSPKEAQRVVLSLPVTATVRAFAGTHLRRAVEIPARPAVDGTREAVPQRGSIRYRVLEGEREEGMVREISRLLQEEHAHHVVLFCRTEDQAADAGDLLSLHGFLAGAPGDGEAPVWLAVDELEARRAVDARPQGNEGMATLSLDVPADPDALDRRHHGGGGVVLVRSRELAHLKDLAARTGYSLLPLPSQGVSGTEMAEAIRSTVRQAAAERSLAGPLLILEPLFREFSAAEVAAALLSISHLAGDGSPVTSASSPASAAPMTGTPGSGKVQAWVRVFISLGEKDGIRAGDLLGAVTGESGVPGSRIGRIEIRDAFSLVEVEREVAEQVIKSLNGVTVRGRAVRADYDRRETRQAAGRDPGGQGGGRPGSGPRRGLPRGGPGRSGPGRTGPGQSGGAPRKGPPRKSPPRDG